MRVAMMALATAYVISPIDLIPEAIFLVFGLADDAVVVAWLAGRCWPRPSASWSGRSSGTGSS